MCVGLTSVGATCLSGRGIEAVIVVDAGEVAGSAAGLASRKGDLFAGLTLSEKLFERVGEGGDALCEAQLFARQSQWQSHGQELD